MSLSTLEADLYRRLGYASSPATEVTTRLRAFLNITHRQILTDPGLEKLRDDVITFASVNGQTQYGLPPAVARIKGIHDRTNQIRLRGESLSWLRSLDPGLASNGGPSTIYVPLGSRQVAKQPSDASEIFVDSTSASDTNTAFLEGIRTGGYFKALSVVMTGVTAVSLGAAFTDFIEITKFYLSSAAIGTVTLHEDASGGTELARIPIGQTFARYQAIQLYPTQSSAVTYHVDYTRTIPDLANANDEPLLPEDFHWILVEGALMKEWQKKDDLPRRRAAREEFEAGLRSLRAWVGSTEDQTLSMRRRVNRHSQLGPWFEAGT